MTRLVVFGSGTCVPTGLRNAPGYALVTESGWLLVDSGSGTLGRLAPAGLDYRAIETVAYTHCHPDHTADLVPLLFALNYTPGYSRTERLEVIGPHGFRSFLDGLAVPYPWIVPRHFGLHVVEVGNDILRSRSGFSVESRQVEHGSRPSVGYRLRSEDGTVVLSGDTKHCEALVELARDADLLVVEASVPLREHGPGNHLTAGEAGKIGRAAGAKHVLLTHFYPICDSYDMRALCAKEYGGAILLAEDLMQIDIHKGTVIVQTA